MIKKNCRGILFVLLTVFLVWGVADSMNAPGQEKNIVETAVAAGSFKTLVTAVKAAGLVDTLSGPGPFTVFAPTDDAFGKLPEGTVESLLDNIDKLKSILTYHVAAKKLMAEDVVGMETIMTVNGKEITVMVKDGKAMVDDALIVKTDIMCSNGVIHVIDGVIIPK